GGAHAGRAVAAEGSTRVIVHPAVLPLTARPITLTDGPGVGQYGGVKLYDFPAGNILPLGAVIDAEILLLTPFINTATGNIGLGTVAPTTGGALTTTKQNIVAATAIAALVAKA